MSRAKKIMAGAPFPNAGNRKFLRILINAIRSGHEVPIVKLQTGLTNEQALENEKTLIAAIGREAYGGPLVNLTDGGEGINPSPITRKKLSVIQKAIWQRPSRRDGAIAALKSRYESQEERDKTGAASRLAFSKEEVRERHRASQRIRWAAEGEKEARSAALTERYKDADERAFLGEMRTIRWAKDGAHERQSATAKALWADPIFRENMMTARRASKENR